MTATGAPRIVVVGSCNQDIVIRGGRLPTPGETVHASTVDFGVGGKGLNQAIAAASAGGAVSMIGAVGTDAAADATVGALTRANVDTKLVRRVSGPTGVAIITVDEEGENTISLAPGANLSMRDLTRDEHRAIMSASVLLLQLEIPIETVTAAARIAHKAGAVVILTPAPVGVAPDELWPNVDIILVNEGEAEALVGQRTDASIAAALTELVPQAVVTSGARGSSWADRYGKSGYVPAAVVDAIDTTGAGDTFAGYLAEAVGRGTDLEKAIGWATAAAAISVTRAGASGSIPSAVEVSQFAITRANPTSQARR